MSDIFTTEVSRHIWETKYRFLDDNVIVDNTIEDTWQRVASALASAERNDADLWLQRFYHALEDFRFLPGGRILAGTGTGRQVTLFNCFVMGRIDDSMDGIFDALKEGALTMQQGGGVGYDFSTLRPSGIRAHKVGGIASGPVSFMRIWDSMCGTLLSTGARRGAMMATLRCDHPDIEQFIDVKKDAHELRHFNLSVLVTDAFMQAIDNDDEWPLVFPLVAEASSSGDSIERIWSGETSPVTCQILRTVRARALWDKIMRATYDYAEPGVLFIDRINNLNNLGYREHISATNPCGEIPLPAYGACNLGSINLTRFVYKPFTNNAHLDMEAMSDTACTATRMLDNVIDLSRFPLQVQHEQAHGSRRIGLGFTGLADTLIMLGLRYDEQAAMELAASVMESICHTAYRASIELAKEKGSFSFFEKDQYPGRPFIQSLPDDVRADVARFGIRNSHLTAIAPTGTISLLANNVSSGLEPVFDFHYTRRVLTGDGSYTHYDLTDYALQQWQNMHGDKPIPGQFVQTHNLSPNAHLDMQAAVQPYVDNAISKTINVPEDYAFDDFSSLYKKAFELGLKGCTTFRHNPITGAIMSTDEQKGIDSHCCDIEREAD